MTGRAMRPMRHRWHFSRKRKTHGDVRCLRCKEWRLMPPSVAGPCIEKAVVVRDRRAS